MNSAVWISDNPHHIFFGVVYGSDASEAYTYEKWSIEKIERPASIQTLKWIGWMNQRMNEQRKKMKMEKRTNTEKEIEMLCGSE